MDDWGDRLKRVPGLRRAVRLALSPFRRPRPISPRDQWTRWAIEHPAAAPRMTAALSLLEPAAGVVCDLGCGPQVLRGRLPPGAGYLPVDVVDWSPDTVVCDLNAGLPDCVAGADWVFALGVVEYLDDPSALLAQAARHPARWIVSYAESARPRRPPPNDRTRRTNYLTLAAFERLLVSAGYAVEARAPVHARCQVWRARPPG